jgi:hypothetical protein
MLLAASVGGLLGLLAAFWANRLIGHSYGVVPVVLFIGWPCIGAYLAVTLTKNFLRSLRG